jgi:O-antigen/teichoic acid export membrane protein
MLRFGWPLVINGFLMFGVLHGDQFLVATFYSMTELGPFAAAATLVMAPTFLFGRVFNSVMLPLLAKAQDDSATFRLRYSQALAVVSVFAAFCVFGMIVGSEAIMPLIYGPQYAGTGLLLALLAAANAFRNIRIAPALAAIAKGDSQNQMYANLWRVTALLPALGAAILKQPVWMIACVGVVGETSACAYSFLRLRRRDGVMLLVSLRPTAWVAAVLVLALLVGWEVRDWNPWPAVGLASVGAILVGAATVLGLPVLHEQAKGILRDWRAGGWRKVQGHAGQVDS